MTLLTRKRLSALGALLGYVIGVGIFGVPYALSRAGLASGLFWIFALGAATITLHLLYAEVVLLTPGHHRLVGYVRTYLGASWARVGLVLTLAANWGSLIAYTLVGGIFLQALLSPLLGGTVFTYQWIFLLVGVLAGLGHLRRVAGLNAWLVLPLILVLLFLIGYGGTHLAWPALFVGSSQQFFAPYGIILFSVTGLGVVPQVRDILGRASLDIRAAIVIGFALVTLLTGAFGVAVLGVTGGATSPDAIFAFAAATQPWILVLGALMGFLAVATSFLLLFLELQETFQYDLRWTHLLSWGVSLSVPVLALSLGVKHFIEVIALTGAVFVGLRCVLILFTAEVVRKRASSSVRQKFPVGRLASTVVGIGFFIGAIADLLRRLFSHL